MGLLRRDFRIGKCRHLRGKFVEPRRKLGMVRTPGARKAQVAVAEETRKRDVSDIGHCPKQRRVCLKCSKPAYDFVSLVIDPFRHAMFRWPPARFVQHQDLCVGQAIGQRLQAQR